MHEPCHALRMRWTPDQGSVACGHASRKRAGESNTSRHLQRRVRDGRANYLQSLEVLRAAKACGVYTKTSIMLGLGETDDEIVDTLVDLRDCGVDIVTFGQYLQPTPRHLPVQEFVTPEKFEQWRVYGERELGFRCAAACGHSCLPHCTLLW